jgi:hypothetical protein
VKMLRRRLMPAGIALLLGVAALVVAGCSLFGARDVPAMSGSDPVAVAGAYGRSLVADQNASHDGADWHFARVDETSATPGAELQPGDQERDFEVFAVRGSVAASSAADQVNVATVGVVKKKGQSQWRWAWSAQEASW